MNAPSASLLRSLLSIRTPCTICTTQIQQTRQASNFMPRAKFAKLTRLDKLHRQQKVALRKEREDSHHRANELESALLATASGTTTSTTAPSSAASSSFPFTIHRTPTSNLPVYQTTKAGGSKHITQVRKLSGDLTALQVQLRSVLKVPEYIVDARGRKKETVAINKVTRQIVVRGWRGPEIKKWAEINGF